MGVECKICGTKVGYDSRKTVDVHCYGVAMGKIVKAEFCFHQSCLIESDEDPVLIVCW